MNPILIKKLLTLIERCKKLENLFSNPKMISNQKQIRSLSKEYKKLSNIRVFFHRWTKINKDIIHTKELLKDKDTDICILAQEELKKIYNYKFILEKKIISLLLSKDPNNNRNCFIELRAATGGKEAALFAGELFRMYARYSEIQKWKVKIINSSDGEYGGYKEIIAQISCCNGGTYGQLKFESGGHRVQRVPSTESQGRIHTSTCTVAVIPEIPSSELPVLNSNELRIDTFRSSGAGGQHVNTTDSAIRITHIPTGLIVECQDERSQHKNKAKALAVLGSRLYNIEMQRRQKETSYTRRNLLGTGERSDRIRTYNFPQGRITDHRINLTTYKLNDILNGDLDILIQPIIQKNNLNVFDFS